MTNTALASAPVASPKVGDVLVSSWGYDQTNICWYRVVAVTKASVRIVSISGIVVEPGGPSELVMPNLTEVATGKGTIKRVRLTSDGYLVSISSYERAYLWDGSSRRQTGWGYGH